MIVTLVAIICSGILCQEVVVPTEMMVAGKASDPIPMTMGLWECLAHGEALTLDWLNEETKHGGQYAGWTLKAPVKCVQGKYESPKRA